MDPTIIIVGAGTLGTSTAVHLAHSYSDPSRIALIDPDPDLAAARDANRMIRTDYPSKLYCDLANEALHAWFWDLRLQRFFHKTGWLVLDEEGVGRGESVRRVFRERGFDRTEDVAVGDAGSRWEGLRGSEFGRFQRAYFNPEVGWVDAKQATGAFLDDALKRGIRRVKGRVEELVWSEKMGKVEGVRLQDGRIFTADKIVLAAGAWTSGLLSPIEDRLAIAERDRLERQVRATAVVSVYYKLAPEEVHRLANPDNMPIVVYGKQGEVIPPSVNQPLLKYNLSGLMITNSVATGSGRTISSPTIPWRDQYDVPTHFKEQLEADMISKLLPEYVRGRKPDHYRICWDSCTPTEDLLMCKYPHEKLDNLFIAAGGSFAGYKFLPNAGTYMVNVIHGKSNGSERDRAFGWKSQPDLDAAAKGCIQCREWRDLQDDETSSVPLARL